jgi:anti-sigma-K factor RskA
MSMENHKERYEELLAGFVLGTLTRPELAEFHALREQGTPPGAMSVEEAQTLLAELPEALNAPAPSANLKERVMARAFVEAPHDHDHVPFPESRIQNPESRIFAGWPALAWAAILLLALTNIGMVVQTIRIGSELASLKTDMAHQAGINEVLTNPTVQVSNMKGTKTDCRARVYYDPDARVVLVCSSSLPGLEPGNDYQLWAMVDGKPVSVGVLKTRRGNTFELNAPRSVPLDKTSTFAISKEPSGGMPQPTGEIVFASL